MRRPKTDAIRRLSAEDVARRLGLIGDTQGAGRSARHRFAGYDGSHWIQFYQDGRWQNYKSRWGGDAISLVQAYHAGPPDFRPDTHDAHYWDAIVDIAEAFDLWESAGDIARAMSVEAAGDDDAREYLTDLMDAPSEVWGEMHSLLTALGVDPDRWTTCLDVSGTGAVCWQPAVPWQGQQISRSTEGYLGGWTLDRAREWAHRPEALSVVLMDFDGDRDSDTAPLMADVDHLVHRLARAGVAPTALVWTSAYDDDRAKAHLYWKCEHGARDPSEWTTWWDTLDEIIDEQIAEMGLEPQRQATLDRDPATRQISRLARVPGLARAGGSQAPIVDRVRESTVDMRAIVETRPVSWTWQRDEHTVVRYQIGETVGTETHTLGDAPSVDEQVYARGLYPVATYQTRRADEHGVWVRIETARGDVRHAPVCAGDLSDKRGQREAAARLADFGARIKPRRGEEVGHLLALAYDRGAISRHGELARRPGWHDQAYVTGSEVIGGEVDVLPDTSSVALQRRGESGGDLSDWTREVASRCTTPALRIAVGVALAGALVRPLAQHPFVCHLAGHSSSGKSTGAHVSASVWGRPTAQGLLQSWDSTSMALEALTSVATDACLVLDELARWRGTEDQLAAAIHGLGATGGRARLRPDSQLREQRRWWCTTLSTGEATLAQRLGALAQGGHAVRALDLWLEQGDCTTSAQHAETLKAACGESYGTAGPALVRAMLQHERTELAARVATVTERMIDRLGASGAEVQRQARIVAIVGVALEIASRDEIVPWSPAEGYEAARWALQRIVAERVRRRQHTPEHRMLRALIDYLEAKTGRAPFVSGDELEGRVEDIVGIRERAPYVLHTCSRWLDRSGLTGQAGVDAVSWLRWLRDHDCVRDHSRRRIAGIRRRWWTLSLDEVEDMLEVHDA